MPLTIDQLRNSIPKKNRAHVKENPAQNNVLANMKALYDLLEPQKEATTVKPVRDALRTILQAVDHDSMKAQADQLLKFTLDTCLHIIYLSHIVGPSKIFGDNEAKVKELIQYIGLGLGLQDRYGATDEQKENVRLKKEADQAKIAEEQQRANEEAQRAADRRKAVFANQENARLKTEQQKDVYTLIEQMKANIKKLPKANSQREFSPEFLEKYPTREAREAALKAEVADYIKTVMSMRLAIRAPRGNADELKKKYTAENYQASSEIIENCRTLDDFLATLSYSDLKDLATKGHGGAFEDSFEKYVKKLAPSIPRDVPRYYLPTAVARIDALKDHIGSRDFMNKSLEHRLSTYMEMMAVRASVHSVRGDKSTLEPVIHTNEVASEKEKISESAVATALRNIIDRDGEAVVRNAATPFIGHGGELDDPVRREIVAMSNDPDNNYRLPNVPSRFAPTYADRKETITQNLRSDVLSQDQKLEKLAELSVLNRELVTNQPGANIADPKKFVDNTIFEANVMKRVMTLGEQKNVVNEFIQNGSPAAYENYKIQHSGEVKAATILENIKETCNNEELTMETLKALAAKKLYVDTQIAQFKLDVNGSQNLLENNVADINVNMGVAELINDKNFNKMCDQMGSVELITDILGNNTTLVERFAHFNEQQAQIEANGPAKNNEIVREEKIGVEIQGNNGPQLNP